MRDPRFCIIQKYLIMAVLWCRSFTLAVWLAIIVLSGSVLFRFKNSRAHCKLGNGPAVHSSIQQIGSPSSRPKTSAGWHEEDVEDLATTETSAKSSNLNQHGSHLLTTGGNEDLAEYAVRVAAEGKRDEILELFAAIENATPDDRDMIARGLQALNAPDIGPDLLAFLVRNARDSVVAVQARDALARIIAPEDIEQISQAVPSEPEQELLRAYLIQTLSQISNPACVDSLFNLCALSKDPDIYSAVSSALGSIGTPDAVASLVFLIEEGGIEDLNDPLSQALMAATNKDSQLLLQDEFLSATNPVVQYATAYALASLNNQASEAPASSATDQP